MRSWQREYEVICEVINQTPDPHHKKEWLKKDIKKTLRKLERKGQAFNYNVFPPSFRWNLCAARMRLGDFSNYDGWEYRSDWSITFQGYNGYQLPSGVNKWYGEDTDKLILMGEQGVGDELLFATAIPDLMMRMGKKIEFQTIPRLKNVFYQAFGIECVDRLKLGELTRGPIVALADLFMFYRKHKSHFPQKPYVKLDPERVNAWESKLPDNGKPNIGIAWKARHGDLDPREMMFEDANYINLQYLKHPDGNWEEPLPEGVIDVGCDPLEDIEGHMHLIGALDKVVTVTQTVVHECGAVGKECHAIRPRKGTGEVDNMLWYYGIGNTKNWVWGSPVYNTVKDYARSGYRSRSVA